MRVGPEGILLPITMISASKLRALASAAAIVRAELQAGTTP